MALAKCGKFGIAVVRCIQKALRRLTSALLEQLYTTWAWAYDWVAAVVSLGEWTDWGRCALRFVPPTARVLEIGHGPGHLYLDLRSRGHWIVGVDRSWQMARRLRQHALHAGFGAPHNVQADARALPFAAQCFDAVIWTFPTSAIFDAATLTAIRRVLRPNGVCVLVLSAELRGKSLGASAVRALYRVTGQAQLDQHAVMQCFAASGFATRHHIVPTQRAFVSVWVLTPQ